MGEGHRCGIEADLVHDTQLPGTTGSDCEKRNEKTESEKKTHHVERKTPETGGLFPVNQNFSSREEKLLCRQPRLSPLIPAKR
jgi:hypothetical protein